MKFLYDIPKADIVIHFSTIVETIAGLPTPKIIFH